tara:strand:- start:11148 stop:12236 length:1089 start_codon:yes stop_codon:yes gene_type:complete
MKKNKLLIFSVFKEDKRFSMEIYLDNLLNFIKKKKFENVKFYIPNIPHLFKIIPTLFNLRMRLARYCFYPLLFFLKKEKFNHIIDQSYSHLAFLKFNSRVVITVHDIIPILFWKKKIKNKFQKNPYLFRLSILALKRADKIICVSEQTKKDIIKYCSVDDSKILVIYNPVNPVFKKLENYKTEKKKIKILLIGNHFYKNIKFSSEIINDLSQKQNYIIEVFWVGGNLKIQKKQRIYFRKEVRIFFKNNIEDSELALLYNDVDLLLFPSLSEGFGWPPLEAMACGTPAICSNIPIFRETLNEAAVLCDLKEKNKFCDAIIKIKEDQNFRNKLINKGIKQVKKFSEERFSKELESVYKNLMSEK